MQTAEIKTSSSAHNQLQMKRQPFFNKEGQGSFFSRSNQAPSSFFSPSTIQPKLTIGQPNDKYEVEADNMADKVVQRLSESSNQNASAGTTSPGIQRKCSSCEEEDKLQKKEDDFAHNDVDVQRKPIFESNAERPDSDIQSKSLTTPNLQAKCSSCEQEEKLQKKEEEELPNSELSLQRKTGDVPSESSPNLESRLSSSKGSGSSLPSDIQSSMGSEFGADFSNVRVHTGTQAVQMSQDIGAQAFTHGSDIYFNQGKYDTNSNSGRHLLAHELTHTVQQSGGMINKQELSYTNVETILLNHEFEEVTIPDNTEIEATTCPDLIPDYPTEPNVGRIRRENESIYERMLNAGGDYLDKFALLRMAFPNITDFWNHLPLSLKVMIIDQNIDRFILQMTASNRLPGNLQLIGKILKPGLVAFAQRLKGMQPELKLTVFERAATLIIDPNFYLGVLKGLVVGFFIDGLVGIVQMIIDIICLVPKIRNFFIAIGRFMGMIPEEIRSLLHSVSQLESELQNVAKTAGQEFNEIINDPQRMTGILDALSTASTEISSKIGQKVADLYIGSYQIPSFHLGEILGRVIGQIIFEVVIAVFTFGGGLAVTAVKGVVRLAGKLLSKIGQFIFPLIRLLRIIFRHSLKIISGVMKFLTSGFRRVGSKLRLVLRYINKIFRRFLRDCRSGSLVCKRRRRQRNRQTRRRAGRAGRRARRGSHANLDDRARNHIRRGHGSANTSNRLIERARADGLPQGRFFNNSSIDEAAELSRGVRGHVAPNGNYVQEVTVPGVGEVFYPNGHRISTNIVRVIREGGTAHGRIISSYPVPTVAARSRLGLSGSGSAIIHPKLIIGQSNNKYEVEADIMADKVVNRLSSENNSFSTSKHQLNNVIQTKCSECEKEEQLQTKSEDNTKESVPNLENRLSSNKGKGNSLSPVIENSMGSAFGANFSGVRVHTGSDSVEMNKELGAQAFTHGSDIYFNQGKYDTNSSPGQHLLAHELTHTIQQGESKTENNIQKYDWAGPDLDLTDDRDEPSVPTPPKVTDKMESPKEWYNKNKNDLWYNLHKEVVLNNHEYISPSAIGLDKKFDLNLSINESRILAYAYAFVKLSSWDELRQYSTPYEVESTIRRILLSRGPLPIDRPEGEYQYYGEDVIYYNREIEKNIKIIFANRVRESLPKLVFQFIAGSYKNMMEIWKAKPYEEQYDFKHVPPHPQSIDRNGYKLPTRAKYPKTQFPDAGFIIPSHPFHKAVIFSLLGGKTPGIDPIKINYNRLINDFKDNPDNILAGEMVLRPITNFEWNIKGGNKEWIKVLQPSEATSEEVATGLYGDASLASEIINASPLFGFKSKFLKLDLKIAWLVISAFGSEEGTDTFLETAILNQSKKFAPTGASQEEIKNRMGFSLMLLEGISTKIEGIGGRSGVGKKVQNHLKERIQILKTSNDTSLSIKWDAHSLAQKKLIKNIHKAIEKAGFIYAQINPDNKQKREELPSYIQTTFFDILTGYSEATDQSDLLETATALFNIAENRSKTLETDQLESQLHEVHESLKDDFKVNRDITDENAKEMNMENVHEKTKKTDVKQLRSQEKLLREQLYLSKSSDPEQRKRSAEKLKILKEKTLHLKEISTLSQWLSHLENFDEFIDKNNEISLAGAIINRDDLFWELRGKARKIYYRYWSIYGDYQDTFKLWGEYELELTQKWNKEKIEGYETEETISFGDWSYSWNNKIMGARERLNLELKNNIQKDLSNLSSWQEKAKDRLAIEKWVSLGFKILASLAVGVVSGGVGSLVGGGLRLGLGWGGTTGRTIAAGVLATGAEAATATGISSIIGLSDPSKGFFDSFVENFIATGLVKSVAKSWDLSLGTKTLKTVAGKEVTSFAVSLSWSLFNANKEAMKKTGKGLTDEQVAETVIQEIGMAIGGLILKRFGADSLNTKLELKGAELTAKTSLKLGFTPTDIKFTNDLGEVNQLRVEAFLAAEKLRKKPTKTLIKEAATKDLAALRSEFELMAKMRRWAMSNEGSAAAKLQGIDPSDLNSKIVATQKEHDSREVMSLLLQLNHEGGALYSAPSGKLKGMVDRYNKLTEYKASLSYNKVTGKLHAVVLPPNGQASFRILESAPQSMAGSKTTKTKFKLSEMYLSLKSTEAQAAFDTTLQQFGSKEAFRKFSRWSKKKGGLEKVLLNKNKNISIENLSIGFSFGGSLHTITIKKIENQLVIFMCTTCGPLIDKIDGILSGLDAQVSTKTLHSGFVKLRNRLKHLENQINENTITSQEAKAQINRGISTLASLENELKFYEIKMLTKTNPLAARKKLASILAKMQRMKVSDVLENLTTNNIDTLSVIRKMELIEHLSESGQLSFESDGDQNNRLHTTYSLEEMATIKTRSRRENTRLDSLTKNTDPNKYDDFVPRPQHEFQEWFDALTPFEFETLWSNPDAKEVIAARVRAPGGLHEWLKVSQLPKLKEWGISMRDIHEFRTLTGKTVGRSFVHGGDGSGDMHLELDRMFNDSVDYFDFRQKLNKWADTELINGRYSLPRGLQIILNK